MTPEPPKLPTGEHPATHEEVSRWGWAHLVAAAVGALGGTGGVVVFLLSYASDVRAQSVAAAQAIATVEAQRLDVIKGDVDVVKLRLEAIDAGVARQLDGLRAEVREATKRSEARADAQEQLLREIARDMKRRSDIR